MGRFDFQSPGAAFVDEMTKILAERKVEQRQKMLDEITRAQEARAERESMEMSDYRKTVEERAAENHIANMYKDAVGNVNMGEDPTGVIGDPRLIEFGQRVGGFRRGSAAPAGGTSVTTETSIMSPESGEPTGAPLVEGSSAPMPGSQFSQLTPQTGSGLVATGTREERDRRRKQNSQGALITGLLTSDNPRDRELGNFLALNAAGNDGVVGESALTAALARKLPGVPSKVFDQEYGTWSEGPTLEPGTEVISRTRPPRPQRDPNPRVIGTTPDGRAVYFNPADNSEFEGTTQLSGGSPLGIAQGLFENHDISATQLRDAGEDPDPLLVHGFRSSAMRIIGNAKIKSERVKSLARMYINNPMAAGEEIKRRAGLAGNVAKEDLLSAEEFQQLDALLEATSAKEFAGALLTVPSVTMKPPTPQGPKEDPKTKMQERNRRFFGGFFDK